MDFALAGVPVAIIIALLVQVAKGAGFPARYAAVLAVALGVLSFASYAAAQGADGSGWWVAIMTGILAGLSASGLYSGGKAVAGN